MRYYRNISLFAAHLPMQRLITSHLRPVIGLIIVLVLGNHQSAFADKGTSRAQLLRVKNLMNANDFAAAWRLIATLEKSDTVSAELYYMGGTCLYSLKEFADAIPRFERSIRLNPDKDIEKYYMLGRVYHSNGKPHQAIAAYESFLAKSPANKEESKEAALYLAQSKRAIEWMTKPMDVRLINLGDSINTEFNEYNPSLAADGLTLIFTSRRPETTGKKQDPDDGLFLEDIYISYRNPETGHWSEAHQVEGNLNTDAHDANLCLSPDGNQMFVYRNMGERGSGEIYLSKLSRNGKWSAAKKVEGEINSSYFESSACLNPDGNKLYFVSEREKKGFGMGDIYISKKVDKKWASPENLGPEINDEYDQIGIFIHPDGKTLYFASDNPKGMGGYDIYKSSLVNDKWSAPENLGYPINTHGDERFIHLSTDGNSAWISSNRLGGKGGIDIWEIDLSNLAKDDNTKSLLPEEKSISILSGQVIDTKSSPVADAEIQITETPGGAYYTVTSDENGKYFITLAGNKNYQVQVKHPGFKPNNFHIFVQAKEKGTFTNEKMIVLE